ncbi:hypothetical protein EIK79_03615 [Halocatena pleomorpha]|uniref:Uncharacterized protein n=1 Tax=Halocatena pleomorpha TaxID=1785090 RepID=A0A3P3RIG2_9EURY|nr:hypothetical protein EIK79_03615 [Halocatena pleomorpha]
MTSASDVPAVGGQSVPASTIGSVAHWDGGGDDPPFFRSGALRAPSRKKSGPKKAARLTRRSLTPFALRLVGSRSLRSRGAGDDIASVSVLGPTGRIGEHLDS